jgi:hypothetical protein
VDALAGPPDRADHSPMSRRLATFAGVCALLAALALPAGAGAVDNRKVTKVTTGYCKAQKKKIGKKAFAKRYGRKAPMKACVKKQRKVIENAYRQAEADCQAEYEEFGSEEFFGEWESMDECIEWYADEYLNPSLPGDDPLDEEEEEDDGVF